jgi:hypothetical protein
MYLFNYHTFHTYYTEPKNLTTNKECLKLYNFPHCHKNNIVCLDEDKTVMGRAFSEFDKKIIKEILQRPFLKSAGGRKRKTQKIKR